MVYSAEPSSPSRKPGPSCSLLYSPPRSACITHRKEVSIVQYRWHKLFGSVCKSEKGRPLSSGSPITRLLVHVTQSLTLGIHDLKDRRGRNDPVHRYRRRKLENALGIRP